MKLDARASADLKAQGQQLALTFAGDWKDEVLLELRGWLAVEKAKGFRTMTIERFRAEAKSQPPSHKAWGTLPAMACKAELLRESRDASGNALYRRAASPKTHAHPVKVWEIL